MIGKVTYSLSKLNLGKNDLWLQLPLINGKVPQIHVILSIQPKMIISVVEAKDLMSADLNGKSDPFVEVVFMNKKQKTQVQKKTLNPTWRETFEFEVWDMNSTVYFNGK